MCFIEEAESQLESQKADSSNSKISLMTGVHRKDIARLRVKSDENTAEHRDILTRVLGRWQKDKNFITQTGRPRTLRCEGAKSEFAQLVQGVAKEINPYTVLFELERVGAIRRTSRGVRMQRRIFNPKGNIKKGFSLLSDDIDDLVSSVSSNIFNSPEVSNVALLLFSKIK